MKLLLALLVTTMAQDCVFRSPLGTFDLSPHIDFGTMGPIIDSSSIFSTYLSVCDDGTQVCQLSAQMALRYQTPTFCSSVVGRWNNPTWELIDGGVRQRFENGDLCFGQTSTQPSKTTIEFLCDPDAVGDKYTTTSDNFQCDWVFTVPSPYACGTFAPTPTAAPTESPIPTAAPTDPATDCGDCVRARNEPGCEYKEVEKCVCEDVGASSCCTSEWHPSCAEIAHTTCGCIEPIDCCNCNIAHGFPGCCNHDVELCVCSFAPFCCQMSWDTPCAEISQTQCGCQAPEYQGKDLSDAY